MDIRYIGEIHKHLEKQNELLMNVYRSLLHELQCLQVEEEMLMRKFHEFMTAQGLTGKNKNANGSVDKDSGALVTTTSGVPSPEDDRGHIVSYHDKKGGASDTAIQENHLLQNDNDSGASVTATDVVPYLQDDQGHGASHYDENGGSFDAATDVYRLLQDDDDATDDEDGDWEH